jgi:hypothetical protein
MVGRQLADLDAIPDATAGTPGSAPGNSDTGEPRDGAGGAGSQFPPMPAAANGTDADRAPSATPAWLNAVKGE